MLLAIGKIAVQRGLPVFERVEVVLSLRNKRSPFT
jgi:hypothetical protein